ncbi:TMV resistance protein N isoform X3 [Quercus suber]|uniref:TMV resistance protein N isoform X3 n=1 Tax=Quercus suber TaxID=58331 RepID=UPI000CE1866A|nr:TMV resistance protein N-like [Quercus suber]
MGTKSLSSSTPQWNYDVFLSFRGEDTRKSFTDHLHFALKQKGIFTFKDNERLERGKPISQELWKAIEGSKFAIVILSKNYASSTWCLDELTKIIECVKEVELTVLPVFYDVDPIDVRKQIGPFAQAFAEHKERFKENIEKVEIWRAALREVADISGYHLMAKCESKFIQDIVGAISHKLCYASTYAKNLVGISSRVEELKLHLAIGSNDVRIIGIWGMGGMDMGQDRVRQECLKMPGKRSRLWQYKDINHVLTENKGTKVVQALVSNIPLPKEVHWNLEALSNMPQLKLLIIQKVQLLRGPNHLSNELRFLDWSEYPSKSFPSSFQPMELVDLRMCYSNIEQLWKGIKYFDSLKSIKLNHSQNLIATPDITGVPNLEKLIVEGCTSLREVHSSVGVHKRLILLNLKGCKSLCNLPCKFEMESLEILIFSGCSKIKNIPTFAGNMKCLSKLYADGTTITKLPMSIEHLTSLKSLSLRDCKHLVCIPSIICNFKFLKDLDFSGCLRLKKLPENLGNAKVLEELDVSGTAIRKAPSSIVLLENLKVLSFGGCKGLLSKSWNKALGFDLMSRRSLDFAGLSMPSLSSLSSLKTLDLSDCKFKAIPNELGCLSSLQVLDLSKNDFEFIPESIIRLSNLKELYLVNCTCLHSLPKLPSSIFYFVVTGSSSLERLPDPLMSKASLELSLSLPDCFELPDIEAHREDSFKILGREEICIHDSNEGRIDLLIPVSELPKWFRHQTMGNKMNIQVNSYLSNKWMGMVLSCVLVLNEYHAPNQGLDGDTHSLACELRANGHKYHIDSNFSFSKAFGRVESCYCWQIFLFPQYFEDYRNGSWSPIDDNMLSQIEIIFETEGTDLEVKKSGAHLLYEQDIEDFKQSLAQSINYVTPYDDYDWLGPRREFNLKPWFQVGLYLYRKLRTISLFASENNL